MVFLSDQLKTMCESANPAELNFLRNKYRHILPPRDLRWLDSLMKARELEHWQSEIEEQKAKLEGFFSDEAAHRSS
jgi:hypothetical protein